MRVDPAKSELRPELRVEGLEVPIADFRLRADFRIAGGERAAIVGPSGSGKTTLLRLIAGLDPFRGGKGRIRLQGRDISDLPTPKRNIGFVFQDQALFPALDVLGNVVFGLRMRGASKEEAEARGIEWLSRVGLQGRARQSIDRLSGGEAQRVAFVRALIWEPELILLDEPFSALDTDLRRVLRRELIELHSRWPVPLLLVTHDSEDVESVATVRLELSVESGGAVREIRRRG